MLRIISIRTSGNIKTPKSLLNRINLKRHNRILHRLASPHRYIVFIVLDKGIFDTNIEYIADVRKSIFLCKTLFRTISYVPMWLKGDFYHIAFIILCKELDHSFKLLGKDLYNLF